MANINFANPVKAIEDINRLIAQNASVVAAISSEMNHENPNNVSSYLFKSSFNKDSGSSFSGPSFS